MRREDLPLAEVVGSMVFSSVRRIGIRSLVGILFHCLTCLTLLLLFQIPRAAVASDVLVSEISITRAEAVKISNIEDWDFGSYGPLSVTRRSLRLRDRTCVFSTTGGYSLRLISNNGGNRLRLLSGAGNRMRYSIAVRYRQGNLFRNQRVRQSDETLSGLAGSLALDCSDQNARNWNLQFRPIIGRNAFNNAQPGVYTDQVTLIVTPE